LRLRQALALLPLYVAALLLVLLVVLAGLVGGCPPAAAGPGCSPWRGSAPMSDLIIEAFKNVIDREVADEALIRDEIKQRGTYSAASEIWRLRRQVKSLLKQLGEQSDGDWH
jgi:hypothetical protein